MTIYQGLLELFAKYGFYREELESLTLKGKAGIETIAGILSDFRNEPLKRVGDLAVTTIEDYQSSESLSVKTGEKTAIELRVPMY